MQFQTEWEKFRDGTITDATGTELDWAKYFFYAGANVMWTLVSKAPTTDVDRLLYMNELQHELLDFIKEQPREQANTPTHP